VLHKLLLQQVDNSNFSCTVFDERNGGFMESLPKMHCKVRKVAENVSWCLAEDSKTCRFSLPFGYAYLCQHSSQYARKDAAPDTGLSAGTKSKKSHEADPLS